MPYVKEDIDGRQFVSTIDNQVNRELEKIEAESRYLNTRVDNADRVIERVVEKTNIDPNKDPEVVTARGNYETLVGRLDATDDGFSSEIDGVEREVQGLKEGSIKAGDCLKLNGVGANKFSKIKMMTENDTDYNNLIEHGCYHQSLNVLQQAMLNRPSDIAGMLEVNVDNVSSMVFQRYTEFDAHGKIFYRTKYGEDWLPWNRIYTDSVQNNNAYPTINRLSRDEFVRRLPINHLNQEHIQDSNFPYSYEIDINYGDVIGLGWQYVHIKYYKHSNNNGYGVQVALPINSQCQWTMKMRASIGSQWGDWEEICSTKPLSKTALITDINQATINNKTYAGKYAQTQNLPPTIRGSQDDGVIEVTSWQNDGSYGTQTWKSWHDDSIWFRTFVATFREWQRILTSHATMKTVLTMGATQSDGVVKFTQMNENHLKFRVINNMEFEATMRARFDVVIHNPDLESGLIMLQLKRLNIDADYFDWSKLLNAKLGHQMDGVFNTLRISLNPGDKIRLKKLNYSSNGGLEVRPNENAMSVVEFVCS